jgi:hypothetical protein
LRTLKGASEKLAPFSRALSICLLEVADAISAKIETDEAGKILTLKKQRPKLLSDLSPDLRKAVEEVTVDRHGNWVPKLYSKTQANRGLRELLNLGAQERPTNDIARLTDAELIQQLSTQANQLGIKINLNYSFLDQQKPDDDEPVEGSAPVIDDNSST